MEEWPLRKPFRTARIERRSVRLLRVDVHQDGLTGRGESFAHERFGVDIEDAAATLRELAPDALEDRDLPPPAADALDAALWDLRAKRGGRRVWELLGWAALLPTPTLYTIGIDHLAAMEAEARAHAGWPVLKIKAEPEQALERVLAVRRGAPNARLVVDANESWRPADYHRLAPLLAEAGVALLEQPFACGDDEQYLEAPRPLAVCADESLQSVTDLPRLRGRYDYVNIKLAKHGGLTRALALVDAAKAAGLRIFVGCMVSTALSIAPALLVAQHAELADLDGPLHLLTDRTPGLEYVVDASGATILPPPAALWG